MGTPGCTSAQPFTADYHRTEVRWNASAMVGHIDHYQVQRKRAGAPDSAYANVVGTDSVKVNHIIDPDVLPKLNFTYRVRAHFDDPVAASGWHICVIRSRRRTICGPASRQLRKAQGRTERADHCGPGVLGVSCTSNNECTPGTAGTGADRSSDNPTHTLRGKQSSSAGRSSGTRLRRLGPSHSIRTVGLRSATRRRSRDL